MREDAEVEEMGGLYFARTSLASHLFQRKRLQSPSERGVLQCFERKPQRISD